MQDATINCLAEQEQEVKPIGVDLPPLIYPQDASLSTHDCQSTDDDSDFIEGLLALPPDDNDLLSYYHHSDNNVPNIRDDHPLEEETVSDPPAIPSQHPPSQPPSEPQTLMWRTIAGSERRPGGGINWWHMYCFPLMELQAWGRYQHRPCPHWRQRHLSQQSQMLHQGSLSQHPLPLQMRK